MYRVAPAWLLTAGCAYDASPVAGKNRTVLLPLDRQIRYAAGVQYDLSTATTLGVAYTLTSTSDGRLAARGLDSSLGRDCDQGKPLLLPGVGE
jgi:long-chain fatty acid transport protein